MKIYGWKEYLPRLESKSIRLSDKVGSFHPPRADLCFYLFFVSLDLKVRWIGQRSK